MIVLREAPAAINLNHACCPRHAARGLPYMVGQLLAAFEDPVFQEMLDRAGSAGEMAAIVRDLGCAGCFNERWRQ